VDLGSKSYAVREYEGYLGPLDIGVDLHLKVYESFKYDVYDPRNVVVIGRGPFAGGGFFGAHRLIVVFRSPLTKGLHVSAVGGAAYRFLRTGLHGLVIEGKSDSPCILLIEGLRDGVRVRFDYLDMDELFEIYKGYEGFRGVRALTKYLISNYGEFIKRNKARALLVGPASFKSCMGAICSPNIDYVKLEVRVEDWAARGGGGSVLAKSHNLVATIYGGQVEVKEGVGRFDYASGLVASSIHQPYVRAVIEGTKKYSYDLETKTGGTLGSNIVAYGDKIPCFNWRSIKVGKDVRKKIHDLMIKYFLEPFNREIIEGTFWRTCGEPCPVRCKKTTDDGKHIDYEPFNGCGPMIGVLDIHDAFEVVDLVDELGYDAIEIGNLLGWLFEAIEVGLLKPEEVGLHGKPVIDPVKWELGHSKINKKLALNVIEEMTYGDNEVLRLIAEKGLRAAAKELDKKFAGRVKELNLRFEDLGVYVSYGEEGHITPNYYWSPGVLAPLAVLGRYWTLYSPVFLNPEEYAAAAIDRAIKEYAVDNSGWCRFHRRWVEKALPKLYRAVHNVVVDPFENAKKFYRGMIEYQVRAGAIPKFWDSSRVIEVLGSTACEHDSSEWCERFRKDPVGAAREWWLRFLRYVKEFFNVPELEVS